MLIARIVDHTNSDQISDQVWAGQNDQFAATIVWIDYEFHYVLHRTNVVNPCKGNRYGFGQWHTFRGMVDSLEEAIETVQNLVAIHTR